MELPSITNHHLKLYRNPSYRFRHQDLSTFWQFWLNSTEILWAMVAPYLVGPTELQRLPSSAHSYLGKVEQYYSEAVELPQIWLLKCRCLIQQQYLRQVSSHDEGFYVAWDAERTLQETSTYACSITARIPVLLDTTREGFSSIDNSPNGRSTNLTRCSPWAFQTHFCIRDCSPAYMRRSYFENMKEPVSMADTRPVFFFVGYIKILRMLCVDHR